MKRLLSEYGSVLVLAALCAYYSAVTVGPYHPISPAAGRKLARTILDDCGAGVQVLIVIRKTADDRGFAEAIRQELASGGGKVVQTVEGSATEARLALEKIARSGAKLQAVATHHPGSATLDRATRPRDFARRIPSRCRLRSGSPRSAAVGLRRGPDDSGTSRQRVAPTRCPADAANARAQRSDRNRNGWN